MVEPTDPSFSPEDRLPKYGQYTYPVNTASPSHQSPVYLESSSYSSRSFGGAPEEQKVQIHTVLENAPYTFSNEERYGHRLAENSVPGSRSLSPSSSTPASTSSTLTLAYPFTFPNPTARFNDRGEIDMRRHSVANGGEVTLHGGTADLSSLSGLTTSDADRYRVSIRKSDAAPDSQHQGSAQMPSILGGTTSTSALSCTLDNNGCGSSSPTIGHQDRASSETDSNGASQTSRLRRRRGTQHTSSRSPSPGPPSLSCTVAVIKAQAFGALRRTRARGKKSSEGAAKVALDVLEARGIGIGGSMSSKRPRLDSEALATET